MSTETMLIERALKDEALKQMLLRDHKDALQSIGESVPNYLDIRILEETDCTRYFVIPQNPNATQDDQLLSDTELDAMAGGWCSVIDNSFSQN